MSKTDNIILEALVTPYIQFLLLPLHLRIIKVGLGRIGVIRRVDSCSSIVQTLNFARPYIHQAFLLNSRILALIVRLSALAFQWSFMSYPSSFFSLAFMVSHAVPSPKQYWSSVLPNTPIPRAINDFLMPAKFGVGHGGFSAKLVAAAPKQKALVYIYAATETQLHEDPSVAIFFLENDMHIGKKLAMNLKQTPNPASFLPRNVAQTIPFSSKNLQQIFTRFSVSPRSPAAETIKNTIQECEAPGIRGEEKYCATSLESMLDFIVSKLGKNVEAISTEVERETDKQIYTIEKGVKKMESERSVVCHSLYYAYAVFYCHTTKGTIAYEIPLVGADGTNVKAVAVCHTNTAAWNPKHLAFQVLGVKPGTVPICHFLPKDHVVWLST